MLKPAILDATDDQGVHFFPADPVIKGAAFDPWAGYLLIYS
jgi:hypothetical protein